jgi:ribosomal protein L24E
VSPPGGRKVMLCSEVVERRTRPKRYKLTVTSKDNQTADKIKEMLKSNINPTEIKWE